MQQSEFELESEVVGKLKEAGMIKSKPRTHAAAVAVFLSAAAVVAVGLQTGQLSQPRSAEHQYILALYSAPNSPGGNSKEYGAWARAHRAGPARVTGGDELAPAVATLGSSAPAGPQLVGFFRISADTDADAVALARTTPHLQHGGSVSIRPTVG